MLLDIFVNNILKYHKLGVKVKLCKHWMLPIVLILFVIPL